MCASHKTNKCVYVYIYIEREDRCPYKEGIFNSYKDIVVLLFLTKRKADLILAISVAIF